MTGPEVRRRNRALRERAVAEALGQWRATLLARRRALASERDQLAASLLEARQTAAAELDTALRRLRDDAREHLELAGPADRTRYPRRLVAAADELARRVEGRLDALFPGTRAGTGAPTITPPGRSGSDRWLVIATASSGVGMWRMVTTGPFDELNPVASALLVGLCVGLTTCLVRACRATAERERLGRWTVEVLGDLRAHLDRAAVQRMSSARRLLEAGGARAVDDRLAALEDEFRRYEQVARRFTERRAGVTGGGTE